jgi:NAD(P)-dependent dehydrogenase (short-subunit alcohol dehydrogenase family)
MHHMRSNPLDEDGFRGSIVVIASTSGYFGGSGVVSYVASKHGVVGLARASQRVAKQHSIRVNIVAPFVTPTHVTANYIEQWKAAGLPMNEVADVARVIVETARDTEKTGSGVMVSISHRSVWYISQTFN